MFIKLFSIALPVFLVLDFLWLGVIARNFYKQELGSLMRSQVNWFAAAGFYLVFLTALAVLVIIPAIEKGSYKQAILYGLLFGLASYAAYDLTNLATLNNWSVKVTIVDLIWGAFLSAAVAVITMYINNKFLT